MADKIIEVTISPIGGAGVGGQGFDSAEDYLVLDANVLSVMPGTDLGDVAVWDPSIPGYQLRRLTGPEVLYDGPTFDTIQQAVDSIFEETVGIQNFRIDSQNNLSLELGESLTGSLQLSWSISIPQTSLTLLSIQNLDGLPIDTSNIDKSSSSPVSLSIDSPIVSNTADFDRLRLTVEQELLSGEVVSKNAVSKIYYTSRLYTGGSSDPAISDSDLLALGGPLRRSRPNDVRITTSGSEYLYLAWPSGWGEPDDFFVGGFRTDFNKTVRDVVNSFGVSREYLIYRSLNKVTANNLLIEVK